MVEEGEVVVTINKQNMKVKFKIMVTTTTTRDCVSIFVSPKLNQLFKEML
jgi:hypothetical protein